MAATITPHSGDTPAVGAPGTADRFPTRLDESWKRSMRHGLRRQDRALFSHCVSKALTKRVVDENQFLIRYARDEMLRLHRSLDSGRWLTLCINVQGQIVDFVGDRTSAPRELRVLMYPGRRILEAELGTTAPGCVLEESRPIVVTRNEHFLLELEEFFCASVPIFGPTSQLAGVLDISGVDVRALPLARDLVEFAARRVENNMVCALRECTQLHFHSDERLVGSPFEAVLAVDSHGIIRGSNRTARQLLLPQAEALHDQPFASVVEGGLERIERTLHEMPGPCVPVHGEFGCLSFLRTEIGRRGISVPRPAPVQKETAATIAQGFICEDPALTVAYEKAVRVLRAGLPIVLHGETGTGKELIARAMHRAVRPQGPLVALNCAAIPEALIESELFGYADGAFTGARKGGSCGKLEQANLGLLFLDEIGDMPLPLQSRLLRALQERTVTRVGDGCEIPVDLLVVCATHRNLQELVSKGAFREDLFYRLQGYDVPVPPLRERADVRPIIEGLFRRWGEGERRCGGSTELGGLVTDDAIECLARYRWPGNIRQLEQVIRALLALRSADIPIDVADLPADVRAARSAAREIPAPPHDDGLTLKAMQLTAIRQALATHGGNVSATAKTLGIARGTLYKKVRALDRRR